MIDEFARSLTHVLVHEGGFANHPKDPGGATMKGVTQRVYDTYRRSLKMPTQSVRGITELELKAIYRREYWDKLQGDRMASGVSYVVFDGAVNSGVVQSVKWLQRALQAMGLYSGKIDGLVGQGTLQALDGVNDNDALIARIIERRETFLRSLKTWGDFGKGWLSRIRGVLKTGQAWASGSVGPQPVYVLGGDAKAFISDAKAAPSRAPGDAAAGAGGLSVVISQAQEQLMPYGTIQLVSNILAGLAIAGVVVAIGGLGYRFWAKRKADELKDALDLQPEAA